MLLLVSAFVLNFTAVDVSSLATRADVFAAEVGMNSTLSTAVTGIALLLLAAVGANAYATGEGDGLKCIVYAHHIPRSQLYLSKLGRLESEMTSLLILLPDLLRGAASDDEAELYRRISDTRTALRSTIHQALAQLGTRPVPSGT